MSLTAQDLVNDARLEAWPHVREETISPASLLRHLTTLDREIVGLLAVHTPDLVSSEGADITIVSATNPTGYALSAARTYGSWFYVDSDEERIPIEIVADGKTPSRQPAGKVLASTFFPVDPLDRNWSEDFGPRLFYHGDGDRVEYRYVAEPPRVTSMTQVLVSPDQAESYIKGSLVLNILLSSGEAVPAERIQLLLQMVREKRQLFLHEATKRSGVSARYGE